MAAEDPDGEGGPNSTIPTAIAVDKVGNVLVAGRVLGHFVGGAIDTSGDVEVLPFAIAVTPADTALVVGRASGTFDLGGGPSQQLFAGFLASYDATGAYLSASTYPRAEFMAIAMAPDGTPVIAAGYEPGTDLGSGPLEGSGWAILKNP